MAPDKATTVLIRRTLCPSCSPNASLLSCLPVLTGNAAVDYELYALLAIIIREYVAGWYGKITPDHAFVDEVVAVVAVVIQNLMVRAQQVDWETLVLDDLPGVVQAHIFGMSLHASCLTE